jgi:vancomycin resistance protein YoaR
VTQPSGFHHDGEIPTGGNAINTNNEQTCRISSETLKNSRSHYPNREKMSKSSGKEKRLLEVNHNLVLELVD